ncbi:MAG TPA: threonine/serine exporter family protein [Candidatus Limnocylindrales bacterium]|nr:threonine/serine exporter family protein [Candidatus Limnocylindrales bacterium]
MAASFGVYLTLTTEGQQPWGVLATVAASLLAVGAFAIRLGVPPRETAQAAILGAIAWSLFQLLGALAAVDTTVAMLVSTVCVGALGRLLARRFGAPSALWVVPAILPFLPGLQMVQAMLADTEQARVNGLVAAVSTGFYIGIGVAFGDVLIGLIRGVRDQVVVPVVGAVAEGVEVFVVGPVGRVVDQARGEAALPPADAGAATDGAATDGGAVPGPGAAGSPVAGDHRRVTGPAPPP